uniref:Uncharacterized protein n=1 Tax=Arundo donax TaxID=35708 RepID=A0A0A9D8K6_ARUDO
MNYQRRLLRQGTLPRNDHGPLDLELTLDIGPRREKRKRSGCNWGKEDDIAGHDQEVESGTYTGLSLSLFSPHPQRKSMTSSGGDHTVLGVNVDTRKAHATRASTLDLTI